MLQDSNEDCGERDILSSGNVNAEILAELKMPPTSSRGHAGLVST